MRVSKYEVFIRTLELGSLTRAGEDLGYTQSGISQMIHSLEIELGTTLLLRGRSGIQLTQEGEELLPCIQNICRDFRQLDDQVASFKGLKTGRVRVGSFTSASCHWIPPYIKKFQQAYPGIDFELLQGNYAEVETWISQGRVDFGFLSLPSVTDLETIPLRRDRLMVVMPEDHPMAALPAFPVERLAGEPFILLEQGHDQEIGRIFRHHQIRPNIRLRVKDDYTVMSMVEHGIGIGILPELVLSRNAYHIAIRETDPVYYRTLGVAMKDRKKISHAARHFLELFLEGQEEIPDLRQ